MHPMLNIAVRAARSAGNVIVFLMECVEKGLLKEVDIGFPMSFGNDESIINAIHLIGKGEGPGKRWGQGVKKLAQHIEGGWLSGPDGLTRGLVRVQ